MEGGGGDCKWQLLWRLLEESSELVSMRLGAGATVGLCDQQYWKVFQFHPMGYMTETDLQESLIRERGERKIPAQSAAESPRIKPVA